MLELRGCVNIYLRILKNFEKAIHSDPLISSLEKFS